MIIVVLTNYVQLLDITQSFEGRLTGYFALVVTSRIVVGTSEVDIAVIAFPELQGEMEELFN